MNIVLVIVQVLLLLATPYLLMRLNRRLKIEKVLSDVVFCYGVGILFANILPFFMAYGETHALISNASKTTLSLAVVVAIPMMLMTMHLSEWLRYTGKMLGGFAIGAISVIICCLSMSYWYKDSLSTHAETSGMLTAVFVGGTPNMAAVGKVVEPTGALFVIVNAVEMFWGGLYFLFLTTLAPKFFGFFLPKFVAKQGENEALPTDDAPEAHEHNPLPWTAKRFRSVGIGLGASLLAVAVSMGLGMLFPDSEGKLNEPILMVGLTTLGIVGSMIPSLRNQAGVYEFAQYLLLVFALAAGSLADFSQIASQGLDYVVFTLLCLVGSVGLHSLLAVIFRIDRDTMMITSTANIFGPAFIGQVAAVLKNRAIVAGGIAMGSLGLAIGNYVGLLVYEISRWM